jgi:hypothetical protein
MCMKPLDTSNRTDCAFGSPVASADKSERTMHRQKIGFSQILRYSCIMLTWAEGQCSTRKVLRRSATTSADDAS